ncbi:MAG: GtrA family protein [Muribaculaceae bacterium]|nr:GtrA family protein [Bacteroides sp.]MDE6680362.1 GtrA family protein [Muribaculaceae bacterium]
MNLKKLINSNNRFSEIVRFGLVGGLATVLQYGIYVVFVHVVGVRAVPSTMISYAISFIFNYILSSYFTFHKQPTTRNGLGFTLSHLINMGLQTGLVAIFKEIVGPMLALLPAMGICIPANYLMVRFAFTSKYFQSKGERKEAIADADTE